MSDSDTRVSSPTLSDHFSSLDIDENFYDQIELKSQTLICPDNKKKSQVSGQENYKVLQKISKPGEYHIDDLVDVVIVTSKKEVLIFLPKILILESNFFEDKNYTRSIIIYVKNQHRLICAEGNYINGANKIIQIDRPVTIFHTQDTWYII